MVLEHLALLVCPVAILHHHRPDPAPYATYNGILRIKPVAEKEREVGREVIYLHPTRQVIFDEGETVGQSKGKLRYRIGTCLGHVITTDRNRIVVTDILVDKVLL